MEKCGMIRKGDKAVYVSYSGTMNPEKPHVGFQDVIPRELQIDSNGIENVQWCEENHFVSYTSTHHRKEPASILVVSTIDVISSKGEGTSDATEALQLSEEMIHMFGEAGMNLRRWATNSTTLHEAWKRANIDCRKTSEKSGVQLKVLGIIWDNVNDNLNFDIRQSEKLNNFIKADICHSYQILKNHGIPDERIILLMTDILNTRQSHPRIPLVLLQIRSL
ncbi:hypothetical protein TNCV_2645291 [Trichonephila clavipes]|nr:hypothetical protein TNCV_2645291 [Trichonephila clavipes]